MSNDIAIKVEGLSKQYRIGGPQERYRTFRDTLMNTVASPFRKARDLVRGVHTGAAGLTETIWALKDVSFEVRRGEVIGIIGPNGAGKTTLLKILSRITEPTEGTADILGRVGSLLEVGTGFHPELSGRENIYLNGAILGMKKAEIDRRFDEIVAFAEVEKFIDTPVKHYSSGMYVRLAFAVAAHLEPEILLVDEVLAVGDAGFQSKCLGKMEEVGKEGRTVFFVSHNMSAIHRLCHRAILLETGKVVSDGATEAVVSKYLMRNIEREGLFKRKPVENEKDQILEVALQTRDGQLINSDYDGSRPFSLVVQIFLFKTIPDAYLTASVRDAFGTLILISDLRDSVGQGLPEGQSNYFVEFPSHLFAPGEYFFTVAIYSPTYGQLDVVQNILRLCIRDFNSQRGEKRLGYFGAKLPWSRLQSHQN